jgi:hypothetical protein
MLNQIQYNTSGARNLVYTHAANIQTLGILQLIADGSFTVTNAYGVIINDLNEYGFPSSGAGALILTNRWGIYQDSTTDVNYFGGTTLIGTTTNNGRKLQVNGGIFASFNVDAAFYSVAGVPIVGYGGTVAQFAPNAYWTDVQLRTNNIPRLQIDVNGRVGIGTATPSKKTVISAPPPTIAGDDGLVILDPSTANQTYLARCGSAYSYLGVPANAGMLYTNTNTSIVADSGYNITFHTSTGRAAFISNAGNFIIGSTTDIGAKLYVNGVTYINTTSSAGDYYLQVGGGIYATNNSVNLSIATQNNRFIAGEYGIGVGTGTFDASQTNGINVRSGTAPATNVADVFVMYAADITAGNAAPHFRTENGNVIKIYQETTGVAASAFTANTGTAVNDASTFDGYTLKQVVKALRNLGILT